MNLTLKPLPRIATLAALLLGAFSVQANLIPVDYALPGDPGITRHTVTGLDWPGLRFTYGQPVSAVPALMAVGGCCPGFRLATAAEFATLYANAGSTYRRSRHFDPPGWRSVGVDDVSPPATPLTRCSRGDAIPFTSDRQIGVSQPPGTVAHR